MRPRTRDLAGRIRACFGPDAADRGQQDPAEVCGTAEKRILAAYLLWLAGSLLSVTMWKECAGISVLSGLARRTAHFLLLYVFLRKGSYTKKDVLGVFLLVFTGIVSERSVYGSFVMPALLFVFFSAQVCFRRILKATLLLQSVFMAVTVTASQTGLIEDVIWQEGERIRHSLGYVYCGYPAHFLLFMTLMWLCLRKRPRLSDTAVLCAVNYLMYRFTDSRTDFGLAVLAAAGAFVWTMDFRSRLLCALRRFLVRYGAVLAAAGSIAAQYFYNPGNPFQARVNQALNNRLQFGADAIRNYGFSLFGKEILWVGQGSLQADPEKVYNYVDCSFLKDGLSFGLLFLILLLIGFYFAGKRLERQGRHMESWAMLVSLAYAVLNAHLCVLYFNVFILLLGENFSGDPLRKASAPEDSAGSFALALRAAVPERLCGEKRLRALRTLLFLTLILYMIFLQCRSNVYVVRMAGLHMWVTAGLLLLLSALCQGNEDARRGRGAVCGLLLLFLVLAGLSDLVLNKRFRNAPVLLLVFGGLFCESWRGMEHPRRLSEEFQWACKGGFVLGLLFCVVSRPAVPGICYSGFLPGAEAYGAVMTVMLAVFLGGMQNGRRTGISSMPGNGVGLLFLREAANGIGAAAALYLVWLTQELAAAAAAAAVLAVYAAFRIRGWLAEPGREKLKNLFGTAAIAAAGFAAVLLLRFLLFRTAPALGTQIVFAGDKNKLIGVPLREGLLSVREWSRCFSVKWKICAAYLRDVNLTGHYYLAKYRKRTLQAASSLVMNLYRYGAAAGFCFGLLLPVCLWKALKSTLRRNDFLPAGLATASVAVGMTIATEVPFANLNWLIFYFVLAWLAVEEKPRFRPPAGEERL